MSALGLRFSFRTIGHGTLHCYRCGGDREYRRCVGRRWVHVLGMPLIPLDRVIEHVQCQSCGTRYRCEVLVLPTAAQMQAALMVGAVVTVTTMLRAGDPASGPARARAIEMVRASGLAGYDDVALSTDLALAAPDIAMPLKGLARQLAAPASEWFLADAIRVGLADGALSGAERAAARALAAHLGLSSAKALDVIAMTEQSTAAG
jgi:hypothetical protein